MMIGTGIQHAGNFFPQYKPLSILDARRRQPHSVERVFVNQFPPPHCMKE
ncbi:MAG: hypothetical protein MUQ48_05670 [Pirellulales bacterium]|nr:hypothetical protein [Pirellulales bacterium]